MNWPADDYSFVDINIWKQFPGKTMISPIPLAVGIKGYKEGAHFGGMGHKDNWSCYKKFPDPDLDWLRNTVDEESFEFYKQFIGCSWE